MKDITLFEKYMKLQIAVDKIKRISFYLNQVQSRYPLPEQLTQEELTGIVKMYLSFYKTLEEAYLEFKESYKESQKNPIDMETPTD